MNVPLLLCATAGLAGAGVSFLTLPLWRSWCVRGGLMDEPGPRKIHQQPVPLAGGLTVLTGVLLPLVAAGLASMLNLPSAELTGALRAGLDRHGAPLGTILAGAVAMTTLGVLDDRRELRPLAKFAGQLLIATAVALAGVRITLFVPSTVFSHVVTVLWLLTVVNAFNFTDNMNGLCAGLGLIAAGCFAGAAARNGQPLVAALALVVGGALLGFLPWNFPWARAFLGDSGSHLVGYLLAVLAILPRFHSAQQPRPWAVLSPLFILAVPLADLVRVVVLRWRQRRPFYVGDTQHLSHRLVMLGLSPVRAVLLLWAAAATAGALSFLLP